LLQNSLKGQSSSDSIMLMRIGEAGDDGAEQPGPGALFYSFNLEEVVPDDYLVCAIAGVLDLSWVRAELAPHYSRRPSCDQDRSLEDKGKIDHRLDGRASTRVII
jgi:hypothetical protein